MTDIIQRIVWKKNLTSGDAKLHSENIVGKKLHLKETKTTFEFRVIPKTKFQGKLKKHTLNPDVVIWTGTLKPEHKHLQRSGMFSKAFNYAKNIFKTGSTIVINNLPTLETVVDTTKKVIDKGSEALFKDDAPTQGKFIRNKRMPENKILWRMCMESYSNTPQKKY